MKMILTAVTLAALLGAVALSDPPDPPKPATEPPMPATEKALPPIDAAAPAKFETATFAVG